jgi:hypothetical protein
LQKNAAISEPHGKGASMGTISQQIRFEEEETHFQKIIDLNCVSALKHFKKVIRSHLLFHLIASLLFIGEGIALAVAITTGAAAIAIILASLTLTVFGYLVLLFYFQAKKPEQFHQLKNWFLLICRKSIPEEIAPTIYHLSLANAAFRLSTYLKERDLHYFSLNTPFPLLNQLLRKITYWLHHKDLQGMKELLLSVAIEEHIALIKFSPLDLEVHASLANAYLTLSHLYRTKKGTEFVALEILSEEEKIKYRAALNQAIEEYKIIDVYAPDDPWVHAQLAACYHELGMVDEEIFHYEQIIDAGQTDSEILFRLGCLYFQQGQTAKGLQIYDKLKGIADSRATELLEHYSQLSFLSQ